MTKQISNMFLRNITCIDHAFVDDCGFIKGGSNFQEIIVSGEVDEHEQVVVDFSTVKKQIKAIIDDKDNGFDHKLWIINGYSKCLIKDLGKGYVEVETPHHVLVAPWNAIKLIDNQYQKDVSINRVVEEQMSKEIQKGLNEVNNVNHIQVDLTLNQNPVSSMASTFSYFHGLKNSSSWGCNNIAHGHTSFVEVYDDTKKRVYTVEKMIAHYLDGAMMIFEENLDKKARKVSYESSRGFFSLTFSDYVKTIVMKQETTIENMVEHICEKFEPVFKYFAISKVFISEGLQKGAMKNIQ